MTKKRNTPKGARNKYDSHVKPNLEKIREWKSNGANEKQICKMLEVSVASFNEYKHVHPELLDYLKKGREELAIELRSALNKRAMGFKYEEKKTYIKKDEDGNKVQYTEITEKYALPDVGALNSALKNVDDDWYNDKKGYDLKKQELELRKAIAERDNW